MTSPAWAPSPSGHAPSARAGQPLTSISRMLGEAQGLRQRCSRDLLSSLSAKLCSHILERHPRCPAASFAFFLPLFDEPDLLSLAQAWHRQGAIACLPAPLVPGEPLSFWPWDFEALLEPGDSRMEWPAPLHGARAILPGLILTPCALFDQAGRRAGYGQGLYQRTLRAARLSSPGIQILGCSLESSRAPLGSLPGDPALDGLATEQGCFDTSRPAILPRAPISSQDASAS